MLQLITPTGDREAAWKLCQLWMARQTYAGPVVWHVTDDGKVPSTVEFKREGYALHMHRLEPMDCNTQARNLAYLLDVIDPNEPVVVIEDDDHYSAGYLADVAKWLDEYELVGECRARYYNVATKRGKQMQNVRHASLCSTAMRDGGLRAFRKAVTQADKFIDITLWRSFPGRLYRTTHVVGIKGLPGRNGIGCGHMGHFGTPMQLSDWIGEDAALYG